MADWGFGTWDKSGKLNNKGLLPTLILGFAQLASGNVSASYNYSVPDGYSLNVGFISLGDDDYSVRRAINISGGSVSVSSTSQASGDNIYPGSSCVLIFYVSK